MFKVREIQDEILQAYNLDFAKHAPKENVLKITLIWNSIASQLAKENKKFIYSLVRQGARAKDFESALQWLSEAGVMAFTLKHIFAKDILPFLYEIVEIMNNIDQTGGRDYISTILQYVYSRAELKSEDEFFRFVDNRISSEIGEEIMTSLGVQAILRGKEQGRQ